MAEQLEIAKVDADGVQFGGTGPLAGVSVSGDFLRNGGFAGAVRPDVLPGTLQDSRSVFPGRRPSSQKTSQNGKGTA